VLVELPPAGDEVVLEAANDLKDPASAAKAMRELGGRLPVGGQEASRITVRVAAWKAEGGMVATSLPSEADVRLEVERLLRRDHRCR
jgi:hypothetical protein